jgi:site-specific recombinase XerD
VRREADPFAPTLEALTSALHAQRYARETIRQYTREAKRFLRWLARGDLPLTASTNDTIARFLRTVPTGRRRRCISALHFLAQHLRTTGVLAAPAAPVPRTGGAFWVERYHTYLEEVLGLALGTQQSYLNFARRFLAILGPAPVVDWSVLTPDRIVEFVRREAAHRHGSGPRTLRAAVHSVLRFLIAVGVVPAGREAVVPRLPRWGQAALPQRLTDAETARLLRTCAADSGALGRRDYVMLLLLARLGLRASEVVRLQLADVDWSEGTLRIRPGKTHRERVLPLAQEVGEGLLTYLQHGRPATPHRAVFLTHTAPYRPVRTAAAITALVHRWLARAGIPPRPGAAHLLRHTAATRMVTGGVGFKQVADVLGHQSLETTALYAKLDLTTLAAVALPWPGGTA